MSIFAIADLHLSLSVDKPMDVFGPGWQNYVSRLEKSWRELVRPEDTILIPGDISWAMTMDEALEDFIFIDSLPGTKILSKGNHDYWWGTNKKVEDFLASKALSSIHLLKNNGYFVENTLIAGSRGWLLPENPESKESDEKIYLREVGRLERSLLDSIRMYEKLLCESPEKIDAGKPVRKIAMLHYPPVYDPQRSNGFTETLEKNGFEMCLYGHLHGRGHQKAFEGVKNGVEYRLISADYVGFVPQKL
ncbi:MAG: metallophosphoesterase [Clostridiales bacterium]|nr:metallophosphoesterase [Clostridiales bacterium]